MSNTQNTIIIEDFLDTFDLEGTACNDCKRVGCFTVELSDVGAVAVCKCGASTI